MQIYIESKFEKKHLKDLIYIQLKHEIYSRNI